MNCVLIQFSPTGGTARVAEALCEGLSSQVELVDLCMPDFEGVELAGEDQLAVIAVPSFGGRVPGLAVQRLQAVKANGMPCVLLCVYGNRAYDDTLVELRDLAQESGFTVIAAVAAVAEHSIIREFAAGRPDATDSQNLAQFAQQIKAKLEAGNAELQAEIPGNPGYDRAPAANGGPYPGANGKCNKCGACAATCPAGAIDAAAPKAINKEKCVSCMRCVKVCPKDARKLNGILTFAVKRAIGSACAERKECELYL